MTTTVARGDTDVGTTRDRARDKGHGVEKLTGTRYGGTTGAIIGTETAAFESATVLAVKTL